MTEAPYICKEMILDNILLVQDEAQKKIGTLFLSESEKKKPRQGTVVKVGPGAIGQDNKNMPMSTKIGDKVIYPEFVGKNLVINGVDYVALRENELILIL